MHLHFDDFLLSEHSVIFNTVYLFILESLFSVEQNELGDLEDKEKPGAKVLWKQ